MVKWLRILIITLLLFNLQSRAQYVTFSVQAHQDDWQLFMSSKIMADLNNGRKVVFITLTAGDASVGAGSYSPVGPYYLAREKGSVYSSKFAVDISSSASTPLVSPTATSVAVNGHNITKYTYVNNTITVVNYFFRLPDGDGNGAGYSTTGNQSLQRLKNNQISSISALGNTAATYTSWLDLTNTIKAIINIEKVTGSQAWIYAAHTLNGTNTSYNPSDHSDHRYASLAAQEAVASGMAWVGVAGFMDYHSSTMGANLSNTDNTNASALFSLCNWGLVEDQYATAFNSSHKYWLPMDYFEVIRSPSGTATFAGFSGSIDDPQLNPSNHSLNNNKESLTEIPMIVSITSPAFIDKEVSMLISPYETGNLTTLVYDMEGNKVSDQKINVEKIAPLLVTLKQVIKTRGNYVIKNILNDKYIETRKIVVE